ncbi:MAG TPA: DUF177 domain-containing protein [Cyclobacteriaceae bacterium]|nr:DUF177 domain-containing protein [Cyclobacteriaceae bacterium]
MKAYRINIVGLNNSLHHFDFEIGKDFFNHYGNDLLNEGTFTVGVDLNKHETFIEADFHIKGTAKLECDRSLELFDYPIDATHKMVFKFGDEDQEITEEIMMINRETVSLEVGQLIYEYIGIAIPMKKLHPKFQDEDDDTNEEGRIVYSSDENIDEEDKESIDPRWEQLKKLK